MCNYTPEPLDTADVELDESLTALTELLAKNTHEVWAQQRMAQGWTQGPRDDKKKTNPCLVEYEKLSDQEKEYDRLTSLETLKTIIKLGYTIVPPEKVEQIKE